MTDAPLPERRLYEGELGGWSDGRLGQAYDLIEQVRRTFERGSTVYSFLDNLLDTVERADDEIKDSQP